MVITADLRNHGQSSHTISMTYPEMAADILQLIGELSLESVFLIGHSMGGKVAMMTALDFPEAIEKLIVLDVAPVRYEHGYGKLFDLMENLPINKIKNRNEAYDFLNREINDPLLSQFLLQNLVRGIQGFQWRINLANIKSNIERITDFPSLKADNRYEKPVLFLSGERSEFIRKEHHKIIHTYFPMADIRIMADAGHMLHAEQPDRVAAVITEYLHT